MKAYCSEYDIEFDAYCGTCSKWPATIAAIHGKRPCSVIVNMINRYPWVNPQVDAMDWLFQFTKENGCNLFEGSNVPLLQSISAYTANKLKECKKDVNSRRIDDLTYYELNKMIEVENYIKHHSGECTITDLKEVFTDCPTVVDLVNILRQMNVVLNDINGKWCYIINTELFNKYASKPELRIK